MNTATSLVSITALLLATGAAGAASIDMDDPYRAVGREFDVRVDAQLLSEIVRHGSPIAITYQIQNFSKVPVAVAEKACSASYDPDSRTITVSVGAEIPPDGEFPAMVMVGPGEKKVISVSAMLNGSTVTARAARTEPRFVQIKVNVLRDLAPFEALLERQQKTAVATPLPLTDDQFDQWFDANRTIFLNSLPVRFESRSSQFDASHRGSYGSR